MSDDFLLVLTVDFFVDHQDGNFSFGLWVSEPGLGVCLNKEWFFVKNFSFPELDILEAEFVNGQDGSLGERADGTVNQEIFGRHW